MINLYYISTIKSSLKERKKNRLSVAFDFKGEKNNPMNSWINLKLLNKSDYIRGNGTEVPDIKNGWFLVQNEAKSHNQELYKKLRVDYMYVYIFQILLPKYVS